MFVSVNSMYLVCHGLFGRLFVGDMNLSLSLSLFDYILVELHQSVTCVCLPCALKCYYWLVYRECSKSPFSLLVFASVLNSSRMTPSSAMRSTIVNSSILFAYPRRMTSILMHELHITHLGSSSTEVPLLTGLFLRDNSEFPFRKEKKL